MSQRPDDEYPRLEFCSFHMRRHTTDAERAECDADWANFLKLQQEADDKALRKYADETGKTVDEVRALFKEIAAAVWEGALSPAGGGQ